jgi:hypothetical protein
MAAPTKTKTASTKDSQNKKPKPTGNIHAPAETITTSWASTAPEITLIEYGSSKPERAAYDKEQERIKADIEALQAKVVCAVSILSLYLAFYFEFRSCISFCTFCGVLNVGTRCLHGLLSVPAGVGSVHNASMSAPRSLGASIRPFQLFAAALSILISLPFYLPLIITSHLSRSFTLYPHYRAHLTIFASPSALGSLTYPSPSFLTCSERHQGKDRSTERRLG